MTKTIIATILLCAGLSTAAQDIICTRPANAPAGKLLTMEETILSRKLTPEWPGHRWEKASAQEFPKEVLKVESATRLHEVGFASNRASAMAR